MVCFFRFKVPAPNLAVLVLPWHRFGPRPRVHDSGQRALLAWTPVPRARRSPQARNEPRGCLHRKTLWSSDKPARAAMPVVEVASWQGWRAEVSPVSGGFFRRRGKSVWAATPSSAPYLIHGTNTTRWQQPRAPASGGRTDMRVVVTSDETASWNARITSAAAHRLRPPAVGTHRWASRSP